MREYFLSHHICDRQYCADASHKLALGILWQKIIEVVCKAGKVVFGLTSAISHNVPALNSHVRDLYEESRHAFLFWRQNDSPRNGRFADTMRRKRAIFKAALRRCRANENSLRAEALANKLLSKNNKSFWRDIKSHDDKKQSLPQKIDQVCGHQNIADLWREKYSTVLNSVADEADRSTFSSAIREVERTPINLVSPEEICILASGLSNNKSVGLDGIPNEFYKYAPTFIHDWMASFINGLLTHCHVPAALTDVLVRPVIKSNLKDPTDSASYRPIALSSSASNIA